ncbi:MAG: PIG-L family deacetylase [Promethearchaeota archaeon]|nr:MAG: PIG-L family deacetylase [Candidatus Lokiarchaeota archaeon]
MKVIHIDRNNTELPVVVPDSILIFAPHPDDELLSCGGTILKYKNWGTKIYIVVSSSGIGGYSKEEYLEDIRDIRKNELEKSMSLLGVDKYYFLEFDEINPSRKYVKSFTEIIRDLRPTIVLAPHPADAHRIHRNTALVAREAVYHAQGKAYGGYGKEWIPFSYYFYESLSCKFINTDGAHKIIVCDISEYWEEKMRIFNQVYKSQKEMLERVSKWAVSTAKMAGEIGGVGVKWGECFIPDTEFVNLKIILI